MSTTYNEYDQAIDWQTVLKQISHFASFSCSQQDIMESMPLTNLHEIQTRLDFVKETMELHRQGIVVEFGGCKDIQPYIQQATKQMVLSGHDLSDIAIFLGTCRNVQHTLHTTEATRCIELANTMDPCTPLMKAIDRQIDRTGSIKLDATPKLAGLHRALTGARLALQASAKAFIKKNKDHLMDTTTSSIGGRLSVLVKAQDKNYFGGMIHGQSQSGLAFYVEPNAFVSANNQIQDLEGEIEQEKERICRELSRQVAKKAILLLSNLETMTILDVAFAKGMWAYQKDGCVPMIQTRDHAFLFEQARHPLIDSKKVVANTYACSKNQYCLMISGPNMGGKTVTLKTIGLFVALAHAGFPVICHRAIVPYYTSLWFDIGDHQSIEQNLSTFSSHISKLATICSQADDRTFVLIDELGNGTDPLEGASLAVAILDYLIHKQTTIITSTHFNEVKAYGKTNDHILVSSVEFDQETLQPTYRYLEGISGSSYAFSIAAQYHLDPQILAAANQWKQTHMQKVDQELARLEKMQNEVQAKEDRFDALIENAHDLQRQAEKEKQQWQKKKEELNQTYEEQLHEMLEKKQEEAQSIIRELKQQKQGKLHEQTALLHQLHVMDQTPQEKEAAPEALQVGDYVQVKGLQSHGTIIDIRKKEATIETNGMRMKVKLNRLTKIHKPNVKPVVRKTHVDPSFHRFPLELNLIGMHVEEGIEALDRYLDQAIVHHVKQVRIIHGMGTGRLRAAVWDDLDKNPVVKSKMAAGPNEGGLGATIVLLK